MSEPSQPLVPMGEGDKHEVVPPPLPSISRRARISYVAAAGLFVVVAFVFWGQHFLDEPEPPAPDHVRYGNVAGQLQLLLQSKVLVGQAMALESGVQSELSPDSGTILETIANEVETLDGAAARALAALHLFAAGRH
ncbi:MAG: hypothetical protein R3F19_13490 [Verrucomicrobiales bacterium]